MMFSAKNSTDYGKEQKFGISAYEYEAMKDPGTQQQEREEDSRVDQPAQQDREITIRYIFHGRSNHLWQHEKSAKHETPLPTTFFALIQPLRV